MVLRRASCRVQSASCSVQVSWNNNQSHHTSLVEATSGMPFSHKDDLCFDSCKAYPNFSINAYRFLHSGLVLQGGKAGLSSPISFRFVA